MKVDKNDRFPKITPNKTSGLGVRYDIDICPDDLGLVHPSSGGLSVFDPPITNIHRNFLPPVSRNIVYKLDISCLVQIDLVHVLDNSTPGHGTIQPRISMTYEQYVQKIECTRLQWVIEEGD